MSKSHVSVEMIDDRVMYSKPLWDDAAKELIAQMDSAANAAGRCVIVFPTPDRPRHLNMNHAVVWSMHPLAEN